MHRKHLVAALAAVALAGTALGGPAGAEDPAAKVKTNPVVKDLLSPLSLDVTDNGSVFYSQNFAGSLHVKRPGKQPHTIYQAKKPGTEVGAVSVDGGTLRFATTFLPEEEGQGDPTAALMGPGKRGKIRQLADLRKYEENRNPDADVTYGIQGLPEGCEVPEFFQPYTGIVDSHPFATAQVGGATYIADAAGNDILKYGARGGLSTVAVLPPQPVVITEAGAEANELPECVVGLTLITRAGAHRRRGRPRRQALRHHAAGWPRGPEPRRPRVGLQGRPEDREGQEGRLRPAQRHRPCGRQERQAVHRRAVPGPDRPGDAGRRAGTAAAGPAPR